MDNNVDLIPEAYEDIVTGKLHIRRYQALQSGLTTVLHERPSNMYE